MVKVAGSGRLTLRNRRFLRCYNSMGLHADPTGFVPPPAVAHTVASPQGDVVPQQHPIPVAHTVTSPQRDIVPQQHPIPTDVPSHLRTPLSVRRADNEDNSVSVRQPSGSPTPMRRVSRTPGRTLFGEVTPEEVAPPAASIPVILSPPTRPSRARTQRRVYDPSTGAYTEPQAVPEHV